MLRILLLDSPSMDEHRVRQESRRAGLSLVYECASGRAGLRRRLAGRPDAVVASVSGTKALPLHDVADMCVVAGVPLVLIGGDTGEEREALARMRGRYTASLRGTRLAWLPITLERLLRAQSGPAAEPAIRLKDAQAALPHTAEQLQEVQKLAIIGRLAGSIAHEINNPLESVTNLAYLMSTDDELPPRLRPYLDLAQRELERVAQISKQTLSFYRETQTPELVELSALWDEVAVLYARRLQEKGIELVRRYESGEPLLLLPGEMRQVYANLLANAIEATEPGGRIVVRVHTVRQARGARGALTAGVRVVVADSGSGIAEKTRARLGQPFYTTKGQAGTGLGLWVSQAIVGRYGGQMRMRSSVAPERHGTTFSIFLPFKPRKRVVEIASPSTPKTPPESGPPQNGLRLLASGH